MPIYLSLSLSLSLLRSRWFRSNKVLRFVILKTGIFYATNVPAIPRFTSFTVIPCKSDWLVKDCQKNSGSFKLLQFYCRHFGTHRDVRFQRWLFMLCM